MPKSPTIWYRLNIPDREPDCISVPILNVATLRQELQSRNSADITCSASALRLEIAAPDTKTIIKLDERQLKDCNGSFMALIDKYKIDDENPIIVQVPAAHGLPSVLQKLERQVIPPTAPQASRGSFPTDFPDKIIDILFRDPDITDQLKKLSVPDATRHVHGHRLVKNNVIPIGPDHKADMRFYPKKLRGQRAQRDFDKLKYMIHDKGATKKIAALLGVSGCGKTATVFEIGSEDFITFFVIPSDLSENFQTSCRDTRQMLLHIDKILCTQQHSIENNFLSKRIAIDTLKEMLLLEKKVLRCIETLLVARRISWSLLYRHFDNKLTPTAWLYCQEIEKFGLFFQNVFNRMINYDLDNGELLRCDSAAHSHFLEVTEERQRFVVAIDECHRLTRYYRKRFLPRGPDLVFSDGTLTESGRYFVELKCEQDPFNPSVVMSPPQCFTAWSYRSVFPLVVQGFTNTAAAALMILGTNLELSNLVELESTVGKYKEEVEVMEMTEFHTFTSDDVISMLRECLNQQGVKLPSVKIIANELEGRARFTMGFLEYVANVIIPEEKPKFETLKMLKDAHVNKIVNSQSNIGLQRHIGSIITNPQNPVSTPQRPGICVVSGKILNALKFLQDILMASMFSRGQMLFPSSEAIKFVRHGLCHLTCSETPWLDDVYESDELDQNTVDVVNQNTKNLTLQESQETQENQEPEHTKEPQETQETEENHYSERSLSPGCSDEDNEDRLSNISLFFGSDVPDRKNLRCTLAEPFVRRALMFYFQQYLHTHSIYMAYLTEIMTSPALTAAARGSLLEWTIMTKIKENWIGKSLRDILEKSLQLQDCKPLPLWLNNSLKVQPFEEIYDESTVSAEDDTLPTFLSGQQDQRPNRALLPSAMAGPDGVCATTMKGVFVIFASALSTKHNIKGEKCSKNIKTTDVEMFYTKSDGQPYKFPQNQKAQYHSMRGRHERIQQLRRDGVFQGFLRIHFNIPKAAGNVRQYEVVKQDGRTDLILNVDLQFAQALHLLDGPIADVLETLCVKDNKGDIE